MSPPSALPQTAPDVLPILAELLAQEPLFHRPAATLDDFARLLAPDFREIGASGRRYSRAFILGRLDQHPLNNADAARWPVSDPWCRRLSPDTYLFTYTLDQRPRRTRRSTIWQRTSAGWQILFHQGTVITVEEDDTVSPAP